MAGSAASSQADLGVVAPRPAQEAVLLGQDLAARARLRRRRATLRSGRAPRRRKPRPPPAERASWNVRLPFEGRRRLGLDGLVGRAQEGADAHGRAVESAEQTLTADYQGKQAAVARLRLIRRSSPSGVTRVSDSTCVTAGRPSGPAVLQAMLSPIVRMVASQAGRFGRGCRRDAGGWRWLARVCSPAPR